MCREHQTDLTEMALGQRPPNLAKCFLGELIHRPTGKWSFLKRGLPDPSIWQGGNRATRTNPEQECLLDGIMRTQVMTSITFTPNVLNLDQDGVEECVGIARI